MEKISGDKELFNKKYVIVSKKGWGGTAKTFLVNERKTSKKYIAKIIEKEDKDFFDREVNFLNILNKEKNPNIIKKIDHGIGYIGKFNHDKKEKKYIILEYAPHRELFDYIYYPKAGFGEYLGKVIFSQILNGVKFIHELGYCHKDLSLSNIFLDENYISKIGDFGTVMKNSSEIKEFFAQKIYKAPEVLNSEPHNGIQADILV